MGEGQHNTHRTTVTTQLPHRKSKERKKGLLKTFMTHQYTKDHHFPTTAMNWMYKYHLYAVHTLIKTGEDKVFRQKSNIPNEEKNKKKSAPQGQEVCTWKTFSHMFHPHYKQHIPPNIQNPTVITSTDCKGHMKRMRKKSVQHDS